MPVVQVKNQIPGSSAAILLTVEMSDEEYVEHLRRQENGSNPKSHIDSLPGVYGVIYRCTSGRVR